MLKLSGFGDEIAEDFGTQLRELRKMDINYIALRNLWGVNVLDLTEAQREKARKLLRKHGMGVSEIGSPLGKVRINESWEAEWMRFERALKAAWYFDAPSIRIFSYYSPRAARREKNRREVIRRLREMAARAEKEDILLLHENDADIYGEDGIHCRDLLESVGSTHFKAIFDPSNFVAQGSRPFTQWWDMLAEHVVHLHVKDRTFGGEQKPAGHGDGEFRKILAALVKSDFSGFATMEPHLAEAGQFSGFSGPELFAFATGEFRKRCEQAGMPHRQSRLAVVGMGFIGGFHCEAIKDVPEVKLVAVADVKRTRGLKAAGERWNVPAYTDLDKMLARDDIDGVTIGTPSGLHGEIALRAFAEGKHVLTEKPLEVTLPKADAMIEASKRHKLQLGVISQHRVDAGIVELKETIDSGAIGEVVLAEAYVKWYRSQEYFDDGGWRGTKALDGGGSLMNQGVHTVDMLQYVVGSPVASVIAQTARATHERIEVEDIAQALLKFRNGALGMIIATTSAYPGMTERLEITGTKGTMIVEGDRVTVREILGERKRRASGEEGEAEQEVGAADPQAIGNRGHRIQLADFSKAIIEKRPPLIGGAEGRKPLEIILAIYESARTGKRVKLPLPGRSRKKK